MGEEWSMHALSEKGTTVNSEGGEKLSLWWWSGSSSRLCKRSNEKLWKKTEEDCSVV
jgi:hypothetical protein